MQPLAILALLIAHILSNNYSTLSIFSSDGASGMGGSLGSQILIALCLGASLHSVGAHASFATLIVVLTLAAMIGGAVPIPGGAGVIEVGLIAGLSAAGVPQDQAVAAVLIERFCTAYLPPIWGWATLVWLRRSDYV